MPELVLSPSLTRENREFAAELKFVVPSQVGARITDWARAHLVPDPNGAGEHADEYRIESIYFDTEDFDVYHRRGSFGRSKFRLRRYGEEPLIFLERKLRTRKMLTKRRSIIEPAELQNLLDVEPNGSWKGSWYHRRLLLRKLRPVCQIIYQRMARVCMTPNGPIRLTVDQQVRAAPTERMAFGMETGEYRLLLPEQMILELKFRVELPMAFKLLIEEFALVSTRVSKYRTAARRLDLVPPESAEEMPAQEGQA